MQQIEDQDTSAEGMPALEDLPEDQRWLHRSVRDN
jgi:hypothetical protein